MITSLAKCGNDCSRCLTYKKNIRTIEDRCKCSIGWQRFLDISLDQEKLRACDGCSVPDSTRKTYYLNCKVRKCAITNEVENCAYCTGYPCEELLQAHSVQQIRNQFDYMATTGKSISADEYTKFIEPYLGLKHLEKLRKTLSVTDYKEYKRFSIKARFAHNGKFESNEGGLRTIHILLTTLYMENDVAYARLLSLKKKREQAMRLLWALGCHGIMKGDLQFIELGSLVYLSQKTPKIYTDLIALTKELKAYDVHCQILPSDSEDWLTPTGALRKKGWTMRLRFGAAINDRQTLVAFKDYVHRLNKKFGVKSYQHFKRADFRVMR